MKALKVIGLMHGLKTIGPIISCVFVQSFLRRRVWKCLSGHRGVGCPETWNNFVYNVICLESRGQLGLIVGRPESIFCINKGGNWCVTGPY